MVTDGTQVKILAWYDNEWGYANRLVELARTVASSLPGEQRAADSAVLPMASDAKAAGDAAQKRRGDLRNYAVGTGAYWTETLVDGATRTLVLFYFDRLGYSPLQVASLFVLYEVAGVVTNLVGGWLAARLGLKITLFDGPGDPGPSAADARLRAGVAARRALRDGLPGAIRHREGPDAR